VVSFVLACGASAQDAPPVQTYGWRGNWTGLYPDCTAPAEWGRIANGVSAADFSGVSAEPWKAKMRYFEIAADHRRPNGEWLDRSSPASGLVHNGLYYAIDEYGVLYVLDLKTGKTVYKQDTGFDELHHYNAIGVAASPMPFGWTGQLRGEK
jgi:hypothetical protein